MLESITYREKQASGLVLKTVARKDCISWTVSDCTDTGDGKPWPDGDRLSIWTKDAKGVTLKFSEIDKVDGRFYFYTPRIGDWDGSGYSFDSLMVHSKLCIIDGSILIVGSSNWTCRSMNYDGELAAFIESCGNLPSTALQRLLGHYQSFTKPSVTIPNLYDRASQNIDDWVAETLPKGGKFVCLFPASHPSFYGTTDFGMDFDQYSPTEEKKMTQAEIKEQRALRGTAQIKAEGLKKTFVASKGERKEIAEASIATIKAMPDYTWY